MICFALLYCTFNKFWVITHPIGCSHKFSVFLLVFFLSVDSCFLFVRVSQAEKTVIKYLSISFDFGIGKSFATFKKSIMFALSVGVTRKVWF